MADAVALTMTDLATPQQVAAARSRMTAQWPPRKWVAEAPHGELPPTLLLESGRHREARGGERRSEAHRRLQSQAAEVVALDDAFATLPEPGRPFRDVGEALGQATLGWRWHPVDRFDLDRVAELLGGMPAGLRIKGVLHTDAGWKLYNRASGMVSLSASAWRRDSRLEIIGDSDSLPSAEACEGALAACLFGASAGVSRDERHGCPVLG